MATYVPWTLITAKAMGLTSSISTWESRETVSGAVHRTTSISATGANTATIEVGTTGLQTGPQQIVNAYVLTANVPTVFNWWIAVAVSSYFHGFSSSGVGTIGISSGYLTS